MLQVCDERFCCCRQFDDDIIEELVDKHWLDSSFGFDSDE